MPHCDILYEEISLVFFIISNRIEIGCCDKKFVFDLIFRSENRFASTSNRLKYSMIS